jgi:hypothetical protein
LPEFVVEGRVKLKQLPCVTRRRLVCAGFVILTGLSLKIDVLQDVTPYSIVETCFVKNVTKYQPSVTV